MTNIPSGPSTPASAPAWPHDPNLFASTSHCPSCFSQLTGAQCPVCGLQLAVHLAVDLFAISGRLVTVTREREAIIARMRAEQLVAERAAAPQGATTATAMPAAASLAASDAQSPSQTPPPTNAPPLSGGDSKTRRSGVQIFLLTIGVILVSVMAVFFVLIAYFVVSLETRSVLTALASVAVLLIAWLLRTRRLAGTAEGIGTLAVVLLLLDVWIIRANDLFGSGATVASAYTGIGFLLLALLLLGAYRITRLRITSLMVAGLVPLGLLLLIFGLTWPAFPTAALWLGLMAAGVSGLFWQLPRLPASERMILRVVGYAAATVAIVTTVFSFDDQDWIRVLALLATCGLWVAHLAPHRHLGRWALYAAVSGGTSVAFAFVAAAFAFSSDWPVVTGLAPVGAVLAGLLVLWFTRNLNGIHPRAGRIATLPSGSFLAIPGFDFGWFLDFSTDLRFPRVGRRLFTSNIV